MNNSRKNYRLTNKQKLTLTFVFSIISYVGLFAASVSMVPLYNIYEKTIFLNTTEITLATFFYFCGCAVTLLFLTSFANIVGRKPLGYLALSFGLLSMLVMINAFAPWMIMLSRFILGLSCGLAANVLSMLVIESGIYQKKSIVNVIVGSMMYVGIAAGALLSGGLEQISIHWALHVYWVLALFLVICLFGFITGNETLPQNKKEKFKTLKPQISIPSKARPIALASSLILIVSWVMGGYFQSYSSLVALEIFHQTSAIASALILLAYMLCNAVGISVGEHFTDRNVAEKVGVISYTFFVGTLAISIFSHSATLCILSILGSGIGQGIGYSNALQKFLMRAQAVERPGLLSFIFLIAYGGAAIVTFISGQLARFLDLGMITLFFFLWILMFSLLCLCVLRIEEKDKLFQK